MDLDRDNPSPLARLPGGVDTNWHDWSPELETAYLQHLAGVERLEDATSLQLVINTAASGSVAHLGSTLPNLLELNLNGSTLDSLRDLGTGFRLLQVLWVSRCGLKGLDGLNGLPSLRELYAAYNDITDLQPVDCCQQLEILDVECNCIPDTDAVLYLTGCSNLQTLTLVGNPAAEKHGYRQAICAVLPSLHCLDDEPVTAADRNPLHHIQQQQQQHYHQKDQAGSRNSGSSIADGGGSRQSSVGGVLPPPPLLLKGATAVAAAAATFGGRSSLDVGVPPSSGSTAAAVSLPPPDAEEVAFVVAGIKHARVGVDSHEFREIEMNLLVATADGTEVQLDVRPGTSALLPASASTWVRTLRSSREGSLAALRASVAARTGSQSPASPCSASPINSRPPSSQQQRGSGQAAAVIMPSAAAPPTERWAVPAGPGAVFSLSSSLGGAGTGSSGLCHWRPGSGTGILSSSCGGAAGGLGASMEGPMRPGSGGYRPGTGRPYSARPGTAASFSARLGTSASTGAAPSSVGLYWAKNRISGSAAASGGGAGGTDGGSTVGACGGGADDVDAAACSSKLTLGSDTTFGGSFARDLRKWKGAAVRAAAAAESAGGAAPDGAVVSSGGGGNGLSTSLLRSGQLDHKALLEELKRWKLETADKVLFVDPDEAASGNGWGGGEGPDRPTGLSGGGAAATTAAGGGSSGGYQADILRLTVSQDGCTPELSAGFSVGLGLPFLESQSHSGGGAAAVDAYSLAVPDSPLLPARPPPGAVAAGRRKMVLAKVLRDIAADSISSSGVCISEILAGLRPLHTPPMYGTSSSSSSGGGGGGGGVHTSGVAWGPPGSSEALVSRDRNRAQDRPSGNASTATPPTASQNHHHNHHQYVPGKSPHKQQQQQQHQQQQVGSSAHRPGSARSVCSSSGHSDSTGLGVSSRPGSRDDYLSASAAGRPSSGGSSGPQLQRQRSTSRAPGLPVGPSAAATAPRVGEVEVRSPNPNPPFRVGGR